ncbi:MAG: sulfite exporter TauE/SafE family protein [Candidatus Omnitrophica bacterium]|nr:sulfite exporter TauE/SafE family protein [Candidatus Omnitrophota bacterium]
MEIFIIIVVSLLASCLTFFSGFGLGTILTPAFLIFFPVEVAIALTAIVHFSSNLLKLALLWRSASWSIVLRFGLPALVAAFWGAQILFSLEKFPPILTYQFWGREMIIMPIKLTIAILMIIFVILESIPRFKNLSLPPKFLSLGGMLSGFLGGLSGHQGALRSMFLLKCNLSKEQFLATGVVIACIVDFSRLSVYSQNLFQTNILEYWLVLTTAIFSAFIGVFIGSRFLTKVTLQTIQAIVALLLISIAILLGSGLI